jgi:hypothetical protein
MRRFDFGRRQLGMARSSRATNCQSPSRPTLVAEGQVTCELIVSVSPCPLLMLWTAPPPARECHGCGC